MVSMVDELVLARPGASDLDREEWLAERRTGVTATELRDLTLKGAAFRQELIGLKLGRREDSFTGNRYTEYGKTREPIIAELARLRHGLRDEHRVFHAADNDRFLASPDLLGVDFDERVLVGEIKTSGKNIWPGTMEFESSGYGLQMQWTMRVMGADRCLYMLEQHDSEWPDPHPLGEPRATWIDRDEQTIAELEEVAERFLIDLDHAREAGPQDLAGLDSLVLDYLAAKRSAEQAKTDLEDFLAARGVESAKTPFGSVSYAMGKPRITFDQTGFKAEHPDLYEAFQKEGAAPSKPTLRVTPVKSEEEAA